MLRICEWEIDYGSGESLREVKVPHAWRQEVPVSWEGPAIYRTSVDVANRKSWLVFDGVSYEAIVRVDGRQVAEHRGIWDAFSVSLAGFEGKRVLVEVEVTKNGGARFPVPDVASGFLPFVFHTFGGIYRDVWLVESNSDPTAVGEAPVQRVQAEGTRILVDGEPFYARGVLTWGWYPEIGHPNPGEDAIEREVVLAKQMGFNLVKFCLWAPPHRYLEILERHGMFAWMELPLWDPSPDPHCQAEIAAELERIVLQYRRHANILFWTAGCELSRKVSAEYRSSLYEMIKRLTGAPLVKDNSGSSEMYGGALEEFGDFYDFHPYSDLQFYPEVLDSLLPGSRGRMPVLLGEFNDNDAHRDLPRVLKEAPYWASADDWLNAVGVRWQHDLPGVLGVNRFANAPLENRHAKLMESVRRKSLFIRKHVQEAVRARDGLGGYVITGWRDTPISSSGFVDDWERPRFSPAESLPWNGPACLYLIPYRKPPWKFGGNRPGWRPLYSSFEGEVSFQVGVHSDRALKGRLEWRISTPCSEAAEQGSSDEVTVEPLTSALLGSIHYPSLRAGTYRLLVQFGEFSNEWVFQVYQRKTEVAGWSKHDPAGLLEDIEFDGGPNLACTSVPPDLVDRLNSGSKVLLFMREEGTLPRPFWREAGYEFEDETFWASLGFKDRWDQLLSVSSDRVLDPDWFAERGFVVEPLMRRIDMRTYEEHPVIVRSKVGKGRLLATPLRPFGGLGDCPLGVGSNPAGDWLLHTLT